jgi:hypothetical protein
MTRCALITLAALGALLALLGLLVADLAAAEYVAASVLLLASILRTAPTSGRRTLGGAQ